MGTAAVCRTVGVFSFVKRSIRYVRLSQLRAAEHRPPSAGIKAVSVPTSVIRNAGEEQWGRLKPDDPQWSAFEVYAWLGAVQESLVQAMK